MKGGFRCGLDLPQGVITPEGRDYVAFHMDGIPI